MLFSTCAVGTGGSFTRTSEKIVPAVVNAANQASRERKVGTRNVHLVRGTTTKRRLRRRPAERRVVRPGQGVW